MAETLRRRTAQLTVGMQARRTAVTPGAQRTLPTAAADKAPSVTLSTRGRPEVLLWRRPSGGEVTLRLFNSASLLGLGLAFCSACGGRTSHNGDGLVASGSGSAASAATRDADADAASASQS